MNSRVKPSPSLDLKQKHVDYVMLRELNFGDKPKVEPTINTISTALKGVDSNLLFDLITL